MALLVVEASVGTPSISAGYWEIVEDEGAAILEIAAEVRYRIPSKCILKSSPF
jgi:hypothetical protein